ncbi:MAG: hypothetical protein ACRERU_06375 [Methylococcales bacterium]
MAVEKTQLLRFDRNSKLSFEFLGFEFYWGRGRWSNIILQRRTSRKKYRAALANLTACCQDHCRLPKRVLFAQLNRKLRGYWNYFGIRGNYASLSDYFYHATTTLLKCFNRRSQKRSYTWPGFRALLRVFPLAKPRICHDF